MKKLYFLFAAALILTGCKSNEEPAKPAESANLQFDTSALKTQPLPADEFKDVSLTYDLSAGTKFTYRLTSISEDMQSIIADTTISQKLSQTITYLIDGEVKEVDVSKIFEIEFKFTSVGLSADVNGQKISYRSGTKMDSVEKAKYTEYEAMINSPFSARIYPTGEILEILRADRISNKILSMKGVSDSLSPMEKKSFQQEISEGALKPLVNQIFRKLTDKKVAKDSTWIIVQPPVRLPIFSLNNAHNYRVAGFEKFNDNKIANIDVILTSKIVVSPDAKRNGVNVNNPSYSGEGKFYFNLDKKLFQKVSTKTNLVLNMEMVAPTPAGMKKLKRQQKTITKNILELL